MFVLRALLRFRVCRFSGRGGHPSLRSSTSERGASALLLSAGGGGLLSRGAWPRLRARRPAVSVLPDGAAGAMDVSLGAARRLFCPVGGCPCADATNARGWTSAHVDAHLSGSLAGRVFPAWLQDRGLQQCLVRGLIVSTRYGTHPTCRPAARAGGGSAVASGGPRAADGTLPSLKDIQRSSTRTLRHVPPSARHAWGQALARALAAVAEYNDEAAWVPLLMLPQCVLCSPPRGGRKHQRTAAAYTLDRLKRWNDGERASLWDTRTAASHRPGRVLRSGTSPRASPSVAALHSLHPIAAVPTSSALEGLPLAPALDVDGVARALRHFPAETAPGPTGLRVQHVVDAIGDGSGVLDHLTAVVNLLAQGRGCLSIAPLLGGAGLVALPKPSGGLRPIAVGELLRRLTGKCLTGIISGLPKLGSGSPAVQRLPCTPCGPGLAVTPLPPILWW